MEVRGTINHIALEEEWKDHDVEVQCTNEISKGDGLEVAAHHSVSSEGRCRLLHPRGAHSQHGHRHRHEQQHYQPQSRHLSIWCSKAVAQLLCSL